MKQVININFQGRVVPIEQSAYDSLKNYIESLNRFFANEEGKEEIINDIESRIAELFQQRLKDGATCITDDDVNAIMKSMGRPEDFESEENAGSTTSGKEKTETKQEYADANTFTASGNKKLFRDENDKILGGVCSGLANYFGIDTVVVRIIFVLLIISFGFGLIPYIILWVVVPSTATTQIGSMRKRLFRDVENKYIAGVCSGLANYFGISTWIPRLLFILPFLSFFNRWNHWGNFDLPGFIRLGFSPGALMVYIILWLVIPEANTTSEKLEMKGEKVDMNSIKNSVVEEMKGVQQRAAKLGHEARIAATEKGKAFASEVSSVGRRSGKSLGDVISLLVKIFVYFILGCVGFALVAALFALAIFAIGIFPLKDFLLTSGWQNAFAWGTLIFFIAVPIIGLITWLIRKIARIKTGSVMMRSTFSGLWVIGLISFILLLSSVVRDFKRENTLNAQEIALSNPGVKKLELTSRTADDEYRRTSVFRFRPFEDGLDDDTAIVRNITVNIFKSSNDSFRVTMLKIANGRTKYFADTAASLIRFNVTQQDTLLVMDKGIRINKDDKFRNQQIVLNVYVPVGKQIRIDNSVSRWGGVHFDGLAINDHNWDYENENAMKGWNTDEDYIMKADGLYTLFGERADSRDDNRYNHKKKRTTVTVNGVTIQDTVEDAEDENDNYRYDDKGQQQPAVKTTLDSLKDKLKLEEKRKADSLKESLEKTKKELEKISKKTEGSTAMNTPILQGYNPMMLLN
ncbi:PspC domain-containing protein [Ferruginibacter sp. HRS2-29]|uniref:PspC domain-containing protein n=1 Tax=Ferruginibacter sp. HRS2-29 TaxID=2487334 RepID=UPI0020CCCADD|nr:PspC domain-containing protein [Ferruginibacter sp. HRS2-29]MCP9752871.1 PspC domain-containing protein [Ferruginibacter sp. HRS2-29]